MKRTSATCSSSDDEAIDDLDTERDGRELDLGIALGPALTAAASNDSYARRDKDGTVVLVEWPWIESMSRVREQA